MDRVWKITLAIYLFIYLCRPIYLFTALVMRLFIYLLFDHVLEHTVLSLVALLKLYSAILPPGGSDSTHSLNEIAISVCTRVHIKLAWFRISNRKEFYSQVSFRLQGNVWCMVAETYGVTRMIIFREFNLIPFLAFHTAHNLCLICHFIFAGCNLSTYKKLKGGGDVFIIICFIMKK